MPALETALATGAPLTIARLECAAPVIDVLAALGHVEITSGCAADYDAWLTGASV